MLNFFTGVFAVAGLCAAAGPVLIHLLNRRRYRTVDWAAMDFLRQAMQRNRRVLQLRDLVLLLVRVLCVLLFGLALARPFFQGQSIPLWKSAGVLLGVFGLTAALFAFVLNEERRTRLASIAGGGLSLLLLAGCLFAILQRQSADAAAESSSRQPVHAVLLIDNSLSMACESLEGTLLDRARAAAEDFIESLPADSRMTVIPVCGSQNAYSLDAYRNKDDARDALGRIEIVDRSASVAQAIELAQQACERVVDLEAKRVVLLSDQQAANWRDVSPETISEKLPELQVVEIVAESRDNVWIEDFRVRDGLADIKTPAEFLARISYRGQSELSNVQVTLSVGNVPVASQTVDLQPGQSRELEFKHQIDVAAEPGRATFVTAQLALETDSLTGDQIKRDNRRVLSVPVVAGFPVVFIDQLGRDREDPGKNEYGETYALRRLLTPVSSAEEARRELIEVRHVTVEQVDIDLLKDARLVVMAGVADPAPAVGVLRQYVQQGGPLVIAAGADFDPALWNQHAWLDGAGILPAPLEPEPFGETLEEAARKPALDPFFLNVDTMRHEYFLVEGVPEEQLAALYRLPLFLKAVRMKVDNDLVARLEASERERIAAGQQFAAEAKEREARWQEEERQGLLGPADEESRKRDQARLRELFPGWYLFRRDQSDETADPAGSASAFEQQISRSRPRVLARFDRQQMPFMVERIVGSGRLLFVSTGAYSNWNTLKSDNAFFLYDRIFRRLLLETLPVRNFECGEPVLLPVEPREPLRYTLLRPSGLQEILTVDALDAERFGLRIRTTLSAGSYQVTADRLDLSDPSKPGERVREYQLAVNGPGAESELVSITREDLAQRAAGANYRWIAAGESISLEGAQIRGRDLWRLLIAFVLVGCVVEMLVLAWPAAKGGLAGGAAA